jgi:hypothetical protein
MSLEERGAEVWEPGLQIARILRAVMVDLLGTGSDLEHIQSCPSGPPGLQWTKSSYYGLQKGMPGDIPPVMRAGAGHQTLTRRSNE